MAVEIYEVTDLRKSWIAKTTASDKPRDVKKKSTVKRTYLWQYLKDNDRSQAGLARRVGVTASYIYEITSGQRPVSERVAEAIAKELKMSVGMLFADIEISKKRISFSD